MGQYAIEPTREPSAMRGVVLVGPASPRNVAPLFNGSDRRRAEAIAGCGGVPVSELAKALVEAGVQVEIVTTTPEVDEIVILQGPRLRMQLAPMRARARSRALSLFRSERIALTEAIADCEGEVVHAHWTYEFAWAALDSRRPAVVTAHDAPLTVLRHYKDAYRGLRTLMAYLVRARTRTLTVVSPYLAGRWRREMGYLRPIGVIPNIAPVIPALPKTKRTARIVDVADSSRLKNLWLLVRALRDLRTRFPCLELHLVGPGLGSDDDFAVRARGEGVADGVSFRGRLEREEVSRVLGTASVFVHPSLEESCSMAVLEAMQAGVPVVAGRRAGGTPWMLDHGRAGLLIDIESPAAIAAGVAVLLEDPAARARLAAAARARVAELFSPSAVVSAYGAVYDRVLREAA
jgi:glycosyltransferase involved in cell wall biosynthesis